MSIPQYSSVVHAEIIGQVWAIASFPSGKASVAVLLTRLFPGKKLKWFLWSLVLLNAIFFYSDAVLIVVQCQPAAYQWDRSIPGGKCWDPKIVTNWGICTGGELSSYFARSISALETISVANNRLQLWALLQILPSP